MLPDVERRKKTLGPLHFFSACIFVFYSATLLKGLQATHILYWATMILMGAWIGLFALAGKRIFPGDKAFGLANRNMRWLEAVLFGILSLVIFSHQGSYFQGVILLCWALAFAFMAWTERALFEPIAVRIEARGIGIPRPGGLRWIAWNQIRGVALRPDFFTVLLPENRYIQFEVTQLLLDEEITEINEFCSSMLKQNTPS
jgi:hypothetical protein